MMPPSRSGALSGSGWCSMPFVALARGAGLIGVDAWNQNEAVFLPARSHGQGGGCVFADAFFVIRRAGADDDEKFIGLSAEHGGNLFIAHGFDFFDVLRDREIRFEAAGFGSSLLMVMDIGVLL